MRIGTSQRLTPDQKNEFKQGGNESESPIREAKTKVCRYGGRAKYFHDRKHSEPVESRKVSYTELCSREDPAGLGLSDQTVSECFDPGGREILGNLPSNPDYPRLGRN